jgi:hypothetical protein
MPEVISCFLATPHPDCAPCSFMICGKKVWDRQNILSGRTITGRNYLFRKYAGKLPEGGTLAAYRAGFGPTDVANAGLDSIEQTIGNYRVDIWIRTFDMRIRLYNVAGRTSFYAGSIIEQAQQAGLPVKKAAGAKSGPKRDITLVLWWDEALPHMAR